MAEYSELANDGTYVFTFLNQRDDQTLDLNGATNQLIQALGQEFLNSGIVAQGDVSSKIEIIRSAFEDAAGSDEELIEAIKYNNYALICFLLTIAVNIDEIEAAQPYEDSAARCLAFAGDIYYAMWTDLCADSTQRLHLVLLGAKKAAFRIGKLVASMPDKLPVNSNGYLGYDERDVQDFDNEGYEQDGNAQREEEKSTIQDSINVWFLVLYQIFAQPVPHLSKKIVASRARKNSRHSSRRLAKLKDTTNSSSDSAAAVDPFDSLDLVSFLTELVSALLDLLGRHQLAEEAHNNCVKVVACINAQMPRLQHIDSNEVAAVFAAADSGESGENMSQGLLYLLNENGYPHIHNSETLASIRLCKDLLNVEKPDADEDGEEGEGHSTHSNFSRGHFYTNDVKVMVDIIIRELSNIPHNTSGLLTLGDVETDETASGSNVGGSKRSSSRAEKIAHVVHGSVRYAYLELLEAIVNKSTWTSSGDCYMKEPLKTLLEEVLQREDEKCQKFVQELLSKYNYYLS